MENRGLGTKVSTLYGIYFDDSLFNGGGRKWPFIIASVSIASFGLEIAINRGHGVGAVICPLLFRNLPGEIPSLLLKALLKDTSDS